MLSISAPGTCVQEHFSRNIFGLSILSSPWCSLSIFSFGEQPGKRRMPKASSKTQEGSQKQPGRFPEWKQAGKVRRKDILWNPCEMPVGSLQIRVESSRVLLELFSNHCVKAGESDESGTVHLLHRTRVVLYLKDSPLPLVPLTVFDSCGFLAFGLMALR